MGSWFSNLSVRKNETVTVDALAQCICQWMAERQYLPVTSEDEADASFAIVTGGGSEWASIYSDIFSFEDPKSFSEIAEPLSASLRADVLGIACFDSDYLYLNLRNAAGGIDAWAGIGSAIGTGIKRRTNLSAWKGKTADDSRFRESVRKKYDFAEEVLAEIAPCLGLPERYSALSYEHLKELEQRDSAAYLYFKLPAEMKAESLPVLVQAPSASFKPFFSDEPHVVCACNAGGASKGLSVYFLGPYVEREEISFGDVCFVRFKNNSPYSIPIELKKVRLPSGQWAYYYHDPEFRLPPKVDDRLPPRKWLQAVFEREIVVRFVPHGNPRKILGITVALVPDKNPDGGYSWNLLRHFGSKEKFIEYHNKTWSKFPNHEDLLLHAEDFD